jgi:hypothetical protein
VVDDPVDENVPMVDAIGLTMVADEAVVSPVVEVTVETEVAKKILVS